MNYILFTIQGGFGKNIAATAVVRAIKKTYPDYKILILSFWKEAWFNNPHIEKVLNPEHDIDIYNQYIKGDNTKIMRLDPYNADDFFHKRKHLVEIWCDLCGVSCDGDGYNDRHCNYTPELYFTDEENQKVKNMLFKDPKDKRPLFFIQPSGGAANQPYPISWARDLPITTAQEVVDKMVAKGYRVIHLRRDNQIPLKKTEWIPFTLREALCSIQFSDKRLFVDSLAAHAAAALNLPSVVTWVTNTPKVFGYTLHTNLEVKVPKEFRHLPDAYLEPYNITGVWSEHPYSTDTIFSVDEIMKALD
jgi:ADP-heptose:LPS heptosyltransferase